MRRNRRLVEPARAMVCIVRGLGIAGAACLLAIGCSDTKPPVGPIGNVMNPDSQEPPAAGSPGAGGVAAITAGTGGSSVPVAGSQGSPNNPTPVEDAGAAGGGADASDAVDAGAPMVDEPAAQTGTLPVPDSLDGPGPYDVLDEPDTGPGNQFRLFAPQPLGQDGLKHPIVAWSPGAGAFPEAYLTLLTRLAEHGFVTLSYNSTAQGPNLVAAIDWLIAQNERADSVLYGKLDTTKIAAGGHSAGSLATYQMADDPRLTTTLHMSGGSFTPQADVPRLRAPALMVCGDSGGDGLITGDLANPMCTADFELAKVPVFYAVVEGGGHTALNDSAATLGFGTAADDPKKLLFIKATIGWLRWQLADDQSLETMFVGDDCALCAAGSGYIVKQKNL